MEGAIHPYTTDMAEIDTRKQVPFYEWINNSKARTNTVRSNQRMQITLEYSQKTMSHGNQKQFQQLYKKCMCS